MQMQSFGGSGVLSTYSVIDLKNIDNLLNSFNKYISGINVNENYYELAKVRTKIFEYGADSYYDMIDLYNFVNLTDGIGTVSSKEVIKEFNKTVVYNYSSDESSNGLSIYFPYNGSNASKARFLSVYDDLGFMNDYKKFINDFVEYRTNSSIKYSFLIDDDKQSNENQVFSITLTDEQVKNYSSAFVYVLKKEKQSDFYNIVSKDNDVQLEGNKLIFKNPKVLKFTDKSGTTYYLKNTYNALKNNLSFRFTLYKEDYTDSDTLILDSDSRVAEANYRIEDNNIVFSNIIVVDNTNEYSNGIVLNKDNYKTFQAMYSKYKILDENGKLLNNEDWEKSDSLYGFRAGTKDFFDNVEFSTFTEDDEYYIAFCITDVFSNVYFSNIIKGGK